MENVATTFQINYTATAAASTSAEVNSTAVDTASADSVLFLVPTSAARIVKLQGGATATSATTDITGASVTTTAAGLAKLEINSPQYRFIRATTVTGVAAVVGDTISILRPRSVPVSNGSTAIVSTTTD